LREYLEFNGTPIRVVTRGKGERLEDEELEIVYQEIMAPKIEAENFDYDLAVPLIKKD
jgi:hypothetical protein